MGGQVSDLRPWGSTVPPVRWQVIAASGWMLQLSGATVEPRCMEMHLPEATRYFDCTPKGPRYSGYLDVALLVGKRALRASTGRSSARI